jgi:hypothetical protein
MEIYVLVHGNMLVLFLSNLSDLKYSKRTKENGKEVKNNQLVKSKLSAVAA